MSTFTFGKYIGLMIGLGFVVNSTSKKAIDCVKGRYITLMYHFVFRKCYFDSGLVLYLVEHYFIDLFCPLVSNLRASYAI